MSDSFRGRPDFDFARWRDARPAAEACPTGAITTFDHDGRRDVEVDYGRCMFCGQCADASAGDVRITSEFELAATHRKELVFKAAYVLDRMAVMSA